MQNLIGTTCYYRNLFTQNYTHSKVKSVIELEQVNGDQKTLFELEDGTTLTNSTAYFKSGELAPPTP